MLFCLFAPYLHKLTSSQNPTSSHDQDFVVPMQNSIDNNIDSQLPTISNHQKSGVPFLSSSSSSSPSPYLLLINHDHQDSGVPFSVELSAKRSAMLDNRYLGQQSNKLSTHPVSLFYVMSLYFIIL